MFVFLKLDAPDGAWFGLGCSPSYKQFAPNGAIIIPLFVAQLIGLKCYSEARIRSQLSILA
ncbi:MAG: hypothetical protein JST20_09180 [Bacteroidetes bacterium]|nr:hypothetical protein [Bacteroidota bacterium]